METKKTPIKLTKISNKQIDTKIWEMNLEEQKTGKGIEIKNVETKLWERKF